ncbi:MULTISPECIES: BRO family protein [Enterococcus]|uniref:BRO family protein n=1 Tax=Enterococcus TaxID=1350 RepID=UPI000936C9C3|nr:MULTISPECIES: phage antirepressor [Enterococcus]MBC9722311.1 phage antirepressor KilAC domain-containing protein [Lactobacillus sp.]VTQ86611.1 toxin-antitoxin system, toxin component, Bro family [Enterococcus hirae]MDB7366974.1 phage antirepressor [Enterococcus faecium]MDB7520727.1 phage antirepressor [Enterococcus faecium]MDB7523467.1 phage antirepressor [Enterococcus faecium]
MNTPQIFNFEQNKVRTILVNDEPYFVGKDVAEILGYERADNAIRNHVDDEDKLTHQISASGQNRNMTIINESGLYSLILKSKLPSAKKFKRWVTSEVLPTIRKHGMYATDDLLNNPDLLIEVATKLKEERTLRLVAEQKVAEMQPKVNYHDIILANKSVTPISFIAKNYGMSAIQMNKLLHDFGIQYRQGKAWLLYAKYQNEGYTHIEMVPVQGTDNLKPIMKWTQKGHLFLYNFLKEHDILPNIELF